MHLYVHRSKEIIPTLIEQWYTREEYRKIQNSDYWFVLYTDQHEKVAECAVHLMGNIIPCLLWGGTHYHISDVLVYPTFRGNNYCSLLLLNVFYYFAQLPETKNRSERGLFRWWTYRQNHPARRAYKKIAKSTKINRHIVEFST